MAQILYKDIIKNKEINEFIKKGDANLATLGYTEHSKTHCTLVAERAAYLLEKETITGEEFMALLSETENAEKHG